MKLQILRFVPVFLFSAGFLGAKDYALINQLPERLSRAKVEGQKGWDSGVTATMKEATYTYNRALLAMIDDLVAAHYRDGYPTKDKSDDYLTALYTVHRFQESAANPTGESRGTMAQLDVPNEVSGELEEEIPRMVQAVTGDDKKFDFGAWKKRWLKAVKK